MGSLLSSPVNKTLLSVHSEHSQAGACKKSRMLPCYFDKNPRLIPNLPDEISLQILARVPRIHYLRIKQVSWTWKVAIAGSEIFQLRKELGTAEEWLYILTNAEENKLSWHALDPLSGKWQRLPPMPDIVDNDDLKRVSGFRLWNVMASSIRIGDVIRRLLYRRDSVDRMPFCGCATGAVDGCLYVLGGFSRALATTTVWRYDPIVNSWQEVSSMSTGRAVCKTSALNAKLYVVGGVSRGRGGLTPLQSAEVFDPRTGTWSEMPSMPFSKAQLIPTVFLAEMLKPIATGMTSYKGRLCVPQSLYSWPFFVEVGGEAYDPETNSWMNMPAGLGEGWPAKQAGTKLSVVLNGELYALDPSSSLDSGRIKMYDPQEDSWKVVIERVPVHDFTESESPYLLAGLYGKLHVITKGVNGETRVLEADLEKCVANSMSASKCVSNSMSASSSLTAVSEEVDNVWKVIAAKDFGEKELISCEVLLI